MNAVTHKPVQAVLVPQNFDQLCKFAEMAAGSDLMPRDYKGKPANIMLAVQMGSELGLQPMQALQSIAVINGRPGVWGDGMIGLCRQSPLCEDIREWIKGEGDERTAYCEAQRKGSSPTLGKFSVADAKKAGLWNKQGPWTQYPDRMLQNRARGFALRDAFPDLLRGLKTVEELRDYPEERPEPRPVQSTVVKPEPRPAPRPNPTLDPVQAMNDTAPKSPMNRMSSAELDRATGSDRIHEEWPEDPQPKPDRLRKVADRFRQRMGEVRETLAQHGPDAAQDAYNGILGNEGVIVEWAKIREERPELDEEMRSEASETVRLIAAARAEMPA